MMNLNTFGSPLLMPRSWPAALPANTSQALVRLEPAQAMVLWALRGSCYLGQIGDNLFLKKKQSFYF